MKLPTLIIPYNWQADFLDKVDLTRCESVYAKLQEDFLGGGRASLLLPSVTRREAKRQIREITKHGIDFNYLFNGSCFDNLEWTLTWRRKFEKLLSWVVDAGVTSVTITIPYLVELIKHLAPHLKITVSVFAEVNEPQKAKYWRDMGVDRIALPGDINRDFNKIRIIRKAVPGVQLILIANLPCLFGCPFQPYHANQVTHASQSGHASEGFLIEYCFLLCASLRIEDPTRYISAVWIRPEDQHYYADAGIDSLKLVDRTNPTAQIELVTKAYTEGRYEGNLMDLFSSPEKNITFTKTDFKRIYKYLFKPEKINPLWLFKQKGRLTHKLPYIDNRKLDGFIDYFVSGKCAPVDCEACGYCSEYANRVIRWCEEDRFDALSKFKGMRKDLVTGKPYKYY